ncbi:hypothetical protein [Nocardioides bruguierae]|uniref:Uncharacterized protein n=1 Tax=Nocardioides bruguierae TaxID=2945102 RepID=A0A9X2IGY1_9ACTN|nr:hypothetical protein [Nocardioides bruguierae]MCM0622493.1 hypothetical protein [Nocardioides bruguierae]
MSGGYRCPSCGKTSWPTRRAAEDAMERNHPHDSGLHAYQCGPRWHYGHPKGTKKPKKRTRLSPPRTRR